MMQKEFEALLEKLTAGKKGRILVAVSGGLDSMTLLHLVAASGKPFAVAHCNFQLRGKDSKADERSVEKAALKLNAPFHCVAFDTKKIASKLGSGIQETARTLRYEWLEKIRHAESYSHIAVAHHLDDSLETFLFNLTRGTGLKGLHGIRTVNGNVIRPLMFAFRNDVEKFAKQKRIRFREDKSNASTKYTRNNIRHTLIPAFEKINPAFRRNLINSILNISSAEQVYTDAVWDHFNHISDLKNESVRIHKKRLCEASHWKTLLYEYLSAFSFNNTQCQSVVRALNGQPGKLFNSPTHILLVDRDHILISPARTGQISGEVNIYENFGSIELPCRLKFTSTEKSQAIIAKKKSMAVFDRAKLRFPLVLRKWKAGDHFFPVGMTGRKKVSDYLTDMKLPRTEKEDTFVLLSGGQVAWVTGMRIDRRFAANDGSTQFFIAEMI